MTKANIHQHIEELQQKIEDCQKNIQSMIEQLSDIEQKEKIGLYNELIEHKLALDREINRLNHFLSTIKF